LATHSRPLLVSAASHPIENEGSPHRKLDTGEERRFVGLHGTSIPSGCRRPAVNLATLKPQGIDAHWSEDRRSIAGAAARREAFDRESGH